MGLAKPTRAMIRALFIVVLALISCTRGEYWQNTDKPGLVLGVIELPDPAAACRRQVPVLGCYDRSTGYIFLKAGMESGLKLCAIRHEYRHAAGDTHPGFDNESPLALDCGDGTIWSQRSS